MSKKRTIHRKVSPEEKAAKAMAAISMEHLAALPFSEQERRIKTFEEAAKRAVAEARVKRRALVGT